MRRYETLDTLRGIAAIIVVVFHLGQTRMTPDLVPHGYLAVDFFFVLSGFVVATAYEAALRDALSLRAFIAKRLIRLYPLAFLGAMMGLAVLLLKWHSFPSKVDPLPRILVSGAFNALMLPTFFGGAASRHEIFPGNGPLWTLFFEVAVNILWATLGVRLRTRTLAAFITASAATLAALTIHAGTGNLGFDIDTFAGGMARVCFGFPLGVLVYRLNPAFRPFPGRWQPVLLGLILIAVLAFPWNADPRGLPWWDLVSVLIILPAIFVLGLRQGGGGVYGRFVGDLSYPIYVLHFPLLLVASGLHQTTLAFVNVHLIATLSFAIVMVLGAVAMRVYDEPARRVLSRAAEQRGLFRRATRTDRRVQTINV
jgi:peptidoglycan/LPS O-acetylase OafA/YrhL